MDLSQIENKLKEIELRKENNEYYCNRSKVEQYEFFRIINFKSKGKIFFIKDKTICDFIELITGSKLSIQEIDSFLVNGSFQKTEFVPIPIHINEHPVIDSPLPVESQCESKDESENQPTSTATKSENPPQEAQSKPIDKLKAIDFRKENDEYYCNRSEVEKYDYFGIINFKSKDRIIPKKDKTICDFVELITGSKLSIQEIDSFLVNGSFQRTEFVPIPIHINEHPVIDSPLPVEAQCEPKDESENQPTSTATKSENPPQEAQSKPIDKLKAIKFHKENDEYYCEISKEEKKKYSDVCLISPKGKITPNKDKTICDFVELITGSKLSIQEIDSFLVNDSFQKTEFVPIPIHINEHPVIDSPLPVEAQCESKDESENQSTSTATKSENPPQEAQSKPIDKLKAIDFHKENDEYYCEISKEEKKKYSDVCLISPKGKIIPNKDKTICDFVELITGSKLSIQEIDGISPNSSNPIIPSKPVNVGQSKSVENIVEYNGNKEVTIHYQDSNILRDIRAILCIDPKATITTIIFEEDIETK